MSSCHAAERRSLLTVAVALLLFFQKPIVASDATTEEVAPDAATTPRFDACLAAMIEADANDNQGLDVFEYLEFTRILADCPTIDRLTTAQLALFYGTTVVTTLSPEVIDISSAYNLTGQITTQQETLLVTTVCIPNAATHPEVCPGQCPVQGIFLLNFLVCPIWSLGFRLFRFGQGVFNFFGLIAQLFNLNSDDSSAE